MADLIPSDQFHALFSRHAFGIKMGLDAMEAMLERLNHPERGLRFIHVAGTNGKGSVSAMLDSVLRAAGWRTGLYTSPHLICFHERIRCNGRVISDPDLSEALHELAGPVAEYENSTGGRELTFFEYTTLLALVYFRSCRPDVVVWETGMGGRLDATNVVTPMLVVVTGIALEHSAYLGSNLSEIATEKAGIIKPKVPLVLGPMPDEARIVFLDRARAAGSRVLEAESGVSVRAGARSWKGQVLHIETPDESLGAVRLPLLGRHQIRNAGVAVTALAEIGRIFNATWPEGAWKVGLEQVVWPGRLHVLSENPVVIVDGAHNPDAARTLAVSLKDLIGKKPLGLILGMCRDKDVDGFLAAFGHLPARCWCVPIRDDRSMQPEALLARTAARAWAAEATTLAKAWPAARKWAQDVAGVVCAAGSLFLVGEIMEREGWGVRLGCPGAGL